MVNKNFIIKAKQWRNPSLPDEKTQPKKTKLTEILQRDENGRPKLSLNPIKKTGVNTQTQEDYWNLMRAYECGGWKWKNDAGLPTELDNWKYEEKTCISAGVGFLSGIGYGGEFGHESREIFQEENWKVISPQDFYNVQKITPKMLKEINVWFDENGK